MILKMNFPVRDVVNKIAFFYWFMVVLKTIFVYLFFSAYPALGSGFNIFLSVLFLVILLAVFDYKRKQNLIVFQLPVKILFFYFGWTFLSLTWSLASSFPVALTYWLGGVFDIVVVILLFYLGDAKSVFRASIQGFSIGAVVLVILANSLLGQMADGRVGSELIHPNSLGRQLSVAAICCFYLILNRDKKSVQLLWYLAFVAIVVGLILTLSKTSIFGFALSFVFIIIFSKSGKNIRIPLGVIFIIVCVLMSSFVEDYIDVYLSSTGDSGETLTGRTFLWESAWEMIEKSWILGYGFFSFRDVGPDIFSIRQSQAHNDFIQQWFTLGIVGVVVTFFIYLTTLTRFWRARLHVEDWQKNRATVGLSLVLFFLLRGFTEADALWIVFPPPLLLLFLLDSLEKNRKFKK